MTAPAVDPLEEERGGVHVVVEPLLCVAGGIVGGVLIGAGAVLAAGRAMNRAARRPSTASGRKR